MKPQIPGRCFMPDSCPQQTSGFMPGYIPGFMPGLKTGMVRDMKPLRPASREPSARAPLPLSGPWPKEIVDFEGWFWQHMLVEDFGGELSLAFSRSGKHDWRRRTNPPPKSSAKVLRCSVVPKSSHSGPSTSTPASGAPGEVGQ